MKKITLTIIFTLISCLLLASCGNDTNKPDDGTIQYSIYELAAESGYDGTYEEWLDSIAGSDGQSVEIVVANGYIQWRYINSSEYHNIIAISELKGSAGNNGKEVELSTNMSHIVWRYVGDTEWQNLVELSNLVGEDGEDGKSAYDIAVELGYDGSASEWLVSLKGVDGVPGTVGAAGDDGREIELSINETHIVWRYVGDAEWQELVELVTLKGADGAPGTAGETGAIGAQGPAGEMGATGADGKDGENGKSAYEIYLQYHPEYTGTEAEWIEDLVKGYLANDNRFTYSENMGGSSYCIDSYIGSDRNIVIPNTYNNLPVTAIASEAFLNCTILESVVVPEIIKSIGCGAFSGCSNLRSMTLPFVGESRTENAYFGYIFGATSTTTGFSTCVPSNLSRVVITDVTTLANYAFSGCSYLTEISLPSKMVSIGSYAFYLCKRLTNFTIPNGITNLNICTFGSCESITSLIIPSSVTTIAESAFSSVTGLTNIIIPATVTTIGKRVFTYCDNLSIYCEATSKPDGWHDNWNPSNRPVTWGYTGE